jgi:hypothetical protein
MIISDTDGVDNCNNMMRTLSETTELKKMLDQE